MLTLSAEDIKLFSKSFLINKVHRYIRMWYITNKLSNSMVEDPDIKPFFTPCTGHSDKKKDMSSEVFDEIDGVLQMQAYCRLCNLGCEFYK